ncbi:MAG: AAA family ATPase [Magnetococcales bacterium]|nr:AAA family ATPase [Magnetococcales bacterium]
MELSCISIRNFRRLKNVIIDIDDKETVFVGPNNSGKTSATTIFRYFFGGRDFKIYDFSVTCIADFEKFVEAKEKDNLPEIVLDLWFSIDPNSIAFGRVFSLLPKLVDLNRVGLRLAYSVKDAKKLHEEYCATCKSESTGKRTKTLYQFLATDNNLSRHWMVRYASLEDDDIAGCKEMPLEPEEGKRLIRHLVRVEFIDAQRDIKDDESSRSNRLSVAFASYYRHNLEQAEFADDAHQVIENHNKELTKHYELQFKPLLGMLKILGVPSINDRELRIISSLSPEKALSGSTELYYIDRDHRHELPEVYNGLGFKNLIFMAIQARHFHSQWLKTEENRPICLIIFIEEPEVHLYAQVQQSFIANIWNVLKQSSELADKPGMMPQLVLTTHSSHILDAVEFEKVRYFLRGDMSNNEPIGSIRSVSTVQSLRDFQPEHYTSDDNNILPEESLVFLKQYLRLTHCDLFFADAAILVEGAAEKLLMPSMIELSAKQLRSNYITVLEVGGAYAHRFEGLLSFLCIPYLVITDLDSVDPIKHSTICRADTENAFTSNSSLKKFYCVKSVSDLMALSEEEKVDNIKNRCVTYQTDILVKENNSECIMRPRTFEEAILYQNFSLLRSKKISIGKKDISDILKDAYDQIYTAVNLSSFKKTDFAMQLIASRERWTVPEYIGLLAVSRG